MTDGKPRADAQFHRISEEHPDIYDLEIPGGGLELVAETIPTFYIDRLDYSPIFITNTGENVMRADIPLDIGHGNICPGEVLAIWPLDLAEATREQFDREERQWMTQEEIRMMLRAEMTPEEWYEINRKSRG